MSFTKHTPEPWRVVDECGGPLFEVEGDGNTHLVCESVSDVNARRIVACVNACAGITTDELEMLARAGKALSPHERRPNPAEIEKARESLKHAMTALHRLSEMDLR